MKIMETGLAMCLIPYDREESTWIDFYVIVTTYRPKYSLILANININSLFSYFIFWINLILSKLSLLASSEPLLS
jgi:hypothetical protein